MTQSYIPPSYAGSCANKRAIPEIGYSFPLPGSSISQKCSMHSVQTSKSQVEGESEQESL
jgi:hypothetical protein